MAWQDQITIIVRTLINDLDTPYDYSDQRIQQVIVVAAKFVKIDASLDNLYNIDVVNNSIMPDPVSNNDDIFLSLTALKTACIIDEGSFRTKAALEGIKTSLGSANLWIQGNLSGYKTLLDQGPCALYNQLVLDTNIGNAAAVSAVLSPFVGNKFDPRYLIRGDHRSGLNNGLYS